MSGLAAFFRPGFASYTKDDNNNNNDFAEDPSSSLSGAETTSVVHASEYAHSLVQEGNVGLNQSNGVALLSADEQNVEQGGSSTVLSWEEWKSSKSRELESYLYHRLIADSNEERTAPSTQADESNDGVHSRMAWNESGTKKRKRGGDDSSDNFQQDRNSTASVEVPTTTGAHDDAGADAIVHVNNTRHDVYYVSDLTMSTRKLVSCNGMIEGLSEERSMRRSSLHHTTTTNVDVDGPLMTVYKKVVSFEVVQKLCRNEDELRQRAQHCLQNGNKPVCRIKVFLYHNYATAFTKLLSEKPSKQHKIAIRMENIPAKCIFPYTPMDWYEDDDLAHFCICVGDRSRVNLDRSQLRFDDNIKLLFQFTDNDITQASGSVFKMEAIDKAVSFEELSTESWLGLPALTRTVPPPTTQVEPPPEANGPTGVSASPSRQVNVQVGANPSAATDQDQGRSATAAGNQVGRNGAGSNTTYTTYQSPTNRSTVTYYKLNQMKGVWRRQKDLQTTEQVHLFAVVLGFGVPYLSKANDWCVSATLIDDSLPLSENADEYELESIAINFFSKKRERLPDFRFAGDVIRIHRAKVGEFNGMVQLTGQAPTSYVTFRGDSQNPSNNETYTAAAVARNYEMANDELQFFWQFWRWGQKRLFSHPTMKLEHKTKICDMLIADATESVASQGDRDFTLMVCAIIAIELDPNFIGVMPRGLLRVWDGTGIARSDRLPEIIPPDVAQPILSRGDPPSECLDRISAVVERIRFVKQSNLVPPDAATGRVVNVVIWEDPHWNLVQQVVEIGTFIRLRNVRESLLYGTTVRCLNVSVKSHLTPLPDLTYEVVQLLEAHSTRLAGGATVNPSTGVSSLRPEERAIPDSPAPLPPAERESTQIESGSTSAPVAPAGDASMDTPLSPKVTAPSSSSSNLRTLLKGAVGMEFRGSVCIRGTVPNLRKSARLTTMEPLIRQRSDNDEDCSWRFAVSVRDGTAQLQAIVTNDAGTALMNATASEAIKDQTAAHRHLQSLLQPDRKIRVNLRSIELQGAKYFLLFGVELPGVDDA